MSPTDRIAITGIGAVSSLGRNCAELLGSLREARCGIRVLELLDVDGCDSSVAGEAAAPGPPKIGHSGRLSRSDRFCILAASEALAKAGLMTITDPRRFGVSMGSSTAGMLEGERAYASTRENGWARTRLSPFMHVSTDAPTDAVARHAGLEGPRLSNMTACCSASLAIGMAADLIREGAVDGMVAGGGDALCLLTYSGFNSLKLVSPEPCRPFDTGRQGMSLGEGAGVLVLESWDYAMARGARPLAELLDYGTSCDAHHMTASHPDGRGPIAAMRDALERSGVEPEEIDYVNAHGTGTQSNDDTEFKVLQALFGECNDRIAVSSTKSMAGHLLGGAGGFEAVTVVLALQHGLVPPTLGLRRPVGDGKIDFVPGHARNRRINIAMSNSFGFGGANVSLVFRVADNR